MIRHKLVVDARLVDALEGYYDSFESIVQEEYSAVWSEIEPVMLDELGYEPRVRRWPQDYPGRRLPFVSERQRRWYWANIGRPYKRTHHLSRNWRSHVRYMGGRIETVVENPSRAAPFVYGSLAQANSLRFQQPFHAVTGWQPAKPTVDYWLNVAAENYRQAMVDRAGALVTGITTRRRAFTRTPRRRQR